jgi:transcriptional regulator with XRE-family HTH domain
VSVPDKLIPEIFGKHLKTLRERSGLTQEALAEAIGVKDARTIRFWEAGTNAPKFANLVALAKALGVRMRDLFDFPDYLEL